MPKSVIWIGSSYCALHPPAERDLLRASPLCAIPWWRHSTWLTLTKTNLDTSDTVYVEDMCPLSVRVKHGVHCVQAPSHVKVLLFTESPASLNYKKNSALRCLVQISGINPEVTVLLLASKVIICLCLNVCAAYLLADGNKWSEWWEI